MPSLTIDAKTPWHLQCPTQHSAPEYEQDSGVITLLITMLRMRAVSRTPTPLNTVSTIFSFLWYLVCLYRYR